MWGRGLEVEADGWSEARTNSGEGSLEMCERKRGFHGAGWEEDGVRVDIVRRRESRRRRGWEAMVVVVVVMFERSGCELGVRIVQV